MTGNFWDERYGAGEYFYGTAPNDFLAAEAARLPPGARVLCLAEGEGRNAVFLAGLGHQVTAVDGSAVGLRKAERLAQLQGVPLTTVVADLNDYAIEPGEWDAIVSIWCHLPPPLRAKVHAAAVAGLAPGGWLLLESYHPTQIGRGTGGPASPELMMTLATLRSEVGDLDWLLAREIERDVAEGAGHRGPSSVTQLVAQKSAA